MVYARDGVTNCLVIQFNEKILGKLGIPVTVDQANAEVLVLRARARERERYFDSRISEYCTYNRGNGSCISKNN